MIFRRFQGRRLDWIYHFPNLYAVDLRPLKEALDEKQAPDRLNYSSSEALAKEEEAKEQDKHLAEMRETLEEGYRRSIEEALKGLPPTTVRAYKAIYGCFPHGWPPSP